MDSPAGGGGRREERERERDQFTYINVYMTYMYNE
jgi:hypothetical protein